jgi:hypothetical protein
MLGGRVGVSGQPMVAERVDQRGNNHPIPGSPRMEHRIRQAPGLIQIRSPGRAWSAFCRPSE